MKQNILLDYQIDIIPIYIVSSSVAMHLKGGWGCTRWEWYSSALDTNVANRANCVRLETKWLGGWVELHKRDIWDGLMTLKTVKGDWVSWTPPPPIPSGSKLSFSKMLWKLDGNLLLLLHHPLGFLLHLLPLLLHRALLSLHHLLLSVQRAERNTWHEEWLI